MKKAALAANIGFLLLLGGYFLTLEGISINSLELLILVFALISPVASILVLLPRRVAGLATRLGSSSQMRHCSQLFVCTLWLTNRWRVLIWSRIGQSCCY
jgi:hypothetical protein